MLRLRKCEDELASGNIIEKNKYLYETYFTVKETPKRGRKVSLNEDAVDAYINGYGGFWIILTDAEKGASMALEHYNRRSDIELHFDDMKNLLDCNRLNVHGQKTMKGRLFVNFITLILLNDLRGKVSAIKPRDRKYWDSKDMLNKVATYSRIHFTGTYKDLWTVPTKAQRLIFDLLKIEYHWKGETLNVEELKETEDDDEQQEAQS